MAGTFVTETVEFDTVEFDTVAFDTVAFDTVTFDTVEFDTLAFDSVEFDAGCGDTKVTLPVFTVEPGLNGLGRWEAGLWLEVWLLLVVLERGVD